MKSIDHVDGLDKYPVLQPLSSISETEKLGPHVVKSADGIYVQDNSGRKYLDAASGLWCVNVGYGRRELIDVASESMQKLAYFHTFNNASNLPQIQLAEKLLSILHEHTNMPDMSKIFYGMSGSDANDTQVKLVWYYNHLRGMPDKKKIISRTGSYHGLTVMSSCLTGIPLYHKAFGLPDGLVTHTPTPPCFSRYANPDETENEFTGRLINELEQLILTEGPKNIGAFIAEPIMGTGGVLLPPRDYFTRVQALLRKYDILFLVDEVICGFGRTGKWFGSVLYGLQPDMMAMAKGLTSAYFPLSAVAITEEIYTVLKSGSDELGPFAHGFTYSGHPVGAAIALANLDIIESEKLIDNVDLMGKYLLSRLRLILSEKHYVRDIRGQGLMCAVELCLDNRENLYFDPALKVARKVVDKAKLDHGILLRALPFNDVIAFSPPFICNKQDIDKIVESFVNALEETIPGLLSTADNCNLVNTQVS